MVPFESFRSKLKAALIKGELRTSDATRKSLAGRKPWDEVMIFKGGIPASRSPLVHAVSRFGTGGYGSRGQDFVALSRGVDGLLKDKGYLAMGGQIIDAT